MFCTKQTKYHIYRSLFFLILTTILVSLLLVGNLQRSQAITPGTNGKIAFSTRRDGNLEVYTANANGTGQVNLTSNSAQDYEPEWSPDGTRIAFRTSRNGNDEIYTMNSSGGDLIRVTNNSATDEAPAWSPDGRKIIFTSNRDGDKEIFTTNPDGTGVVQITSNATAETDPAWSPDGTKIAFITGRDGNDEVYVMNADGSNQTRITNNVVLDANPIWSPDGTKIVYAQQASFFFIHTVNADGTGDANISLAGGTTNDFDPTWSADGTKIIFATRVGGATTDNEVYQMNTDGTSRTSLVINPLLDSQPSAQSIPDRDLDGTPDASDPDDDGDGVSDTTENNAPNSGDGNNDGILDSIQCFVASFTDTASNYVMLVSSIGTQLDSVSAAAPSSSGNLPGSIVPARGVFSFKVKNVTAGSTVAVSLTFADSYTPVSVFKYGPETGNTTPHYYNFADNGTTGAIIGTGSVTLRITDGGRGDRDQTANGIIDDPVAFSSSAPGSDAELADTGSSIIIVFIIFGIFIIAGASGLTLTLQRS